ncbi:MULTISPECIES: AEC family transporter [Bacillaceae]|uniref:AEC family transporter n=1 Tax=Evansella alkalicola TaxID=745819 RepID=A0ABS6JWP2_9BACI|nr:MULTISPECIES: AEC family transporter [Bacillaceae]MBU9722989.1 AEC family transporter [Bacillus alkalicola]
MSGFIFALSIIVIGLLFGRGLRLLLDKGLFIESPNKMHQVLKRSTMTALLVINPIIILGAFWFVQLEDFRLVYIPILGALAIGLGGSLALLAGKFLKLENKQKGALFASGTFTNLGSFGALFCFVFFGEASLVFVALFRLFEDLLYYTVGFPISQSYGENKLKEQTVPLWKKIGTNPFIIMTLTAIIIGGSLNLSPWDRPEVYADLNSILVPIFTILLVVPTGFNLKVSKVKGFLKESFMIAGIKYLIVPVTVTFLALALGLKDIYDGIALKTVIILAAMPPGFTSLVPPQLFGLDQDLANSSWFVNTVLLILVLPVLYFITMIF